MISLLVSVLILILVCGAVFWVVGMMPLPSPFNNAAKIIIGVIFILVLLGMLFGHVPMVPVLR